jgi:glycosyltransferase involved in cell wall biosynthesis
MSDYLILFNEFYKKRNLAQCELILRMMIRQNLGDPDQRAYFKQKIQMGYGATGEFSTKKFLYIPAWGQGFWSDVHFVLGGLLISELLCRTPIVYWGSNTRFSSQIEGNQFTQYFEPIDSDFFWKVKDFIKIWPPKYKNHQLQKIQPLIPANNWSGPYSRLTYLRYVNRPEPIVVYDFFEPVESLIPYIPYYHEFYNKNEDEIYRQLYQKYLRFSDSMLAKIRPTLVHMNPLNSLAVHLRGTDKVNEANDLDKSNQDILDWLDSYALKNKTSSIFLMTDSEVIYNSLTNKYGQRIASNNVLRGSGNVGLHAQELNGLQLGHEVIGDVLAALECERFIGNLESNVSRAIYWQKDWKENAKLFGAWSLLSENWYLHKDGGEHLPGSVFKCRLCDGTTILRPELDHLYDDIQYLECERCQALQTITPYWIANEKINNGNSLDTGIAQRSYLMAAITQSIITAIGVSMDSPCLDIGGGGGLFCRLMRDQGWNFFTYDPFEQARFAKSYEVDALIKGFVVVTIIETASEFEDPLNEWKGIFAIAPEIIIMSTELYQGDATSLIPLLGANREKNFIYSETTIDLLANSFGYSKSIIGGIILLTRFKLQDDQVEKLHAVLTTPSVYMDAYYKSWKMNGFKHASADQAKLKKRLVLSKPKKIIIDCYFLQLNSGIAKLWRELLLEWSRSGFSKQICCVDYNGTTPKYPGFSYYSFEKKAFGPVSEGELLDTVLGTNISLFISTYYSFSTQFPCLQLLYDFIPELLDFNLEEAQWQEKKMAIENAVAYFGISRNTLEDFKKCYPDHAKKPMAYSHLGTRFYQRDIEEIRRFRRSYGITRSYFIWCGARDGYKNFELFMLAMRLLSNKKNEFEIILTNSKNSLSGYEKRMLEGFKVSELILTEEELNIAMTGASALVYTSKYEGFGLPLIEGFAAGCPVITCKNSSIREVCNDRALYVEESDPNKLAAILISILQKNNDASQVSQNINYGKTFTWSKFAETFESFVLDSLCTLK